MSRQSRAKPGAGPLEEIQILGQERPEDPWPGQHRSNAGHSAPWQREHRQVGPRQCMKLSSRLRHECLIRRRRLVAPELVIQHLPQQVPALEPGQNCSSDPLPRQRQAVPGGVAGDEHPVHDGRAQSGCQKSTVHGGRLLPEAAHELLQGRSQLAPTQVAEHAEPDPFPGWKCPSIAIPHLRQEVEVKPGLMRAHHFRLNAKCHPAPIHVCRAGRCGERGSPPGGISEKRSRECPSPRRVHRRSRPPCDCCLEELDPGARPREFTEPLVVERAERFRQRPHGFTRRRMQDQPIVNLQDGSFRTHGVDDRDWCPTRRRDPAPHRRTVQQDDAPTLKALGHGQTGKTSASDDDIELPGTRKHGNAETRHSYIAGGNASRVSSFPCFPVSVSQARQTLPAPSRPSISASSSAVAATRRSRALITTSRPEARRCRNTGRSPRRWASKAFNRCSPASPSRAVSTRTCSADGDGRASGFGPRASTRSGVESLSADSVLSPFKAPAGWSRGSGSTSSASSSVITRSARIFACCSITSTFPRTTRTASRFSKKCTCSYARGKMMTSQLPVRSSSVTNAIADPPLVVVRLTAVIRPPTVTGVLSGNSSNWSSATLIRAASVA